MNSPGTLQEVKTCRPPACSCIVRLLVDVFPVTSVGRSTRVTKQAPKQQKVFSVLFDVRCVGVCTRGCFCLKRDAANTKQKKKTGCVGVSHKGDAIENSLSMLRQHGREGGYPTSSHKPWLLFLSTARCLRVTTRWLSSISSAISQLSLPSFGCCVVLLRTKL